MNDFGLIFIKYEYRHRLRLLAFDAKRRILEKTVRQSDWKLIRALPLFCEMSEANFEDTGERRVSAALSRSTSP